MPGFVKRFFKLSFRTERLIMNIIGLINSTLDWSPLKWTNRLEQIWNLSLSQRTLILDIIGEDTIKIVLSWIVITRIVIAHVYTLTYIINIYPMLTWRQPNLLLPWLILSFFKNVVLEGIVIAISLLLWYDKRFSLVFFLEFIFVKTVPLLLSMYNWYSNTRLYLQLRRTDKLRKLKSMRSDSNLIVRLYIQAADSKYRTRSLTTLLSYESYDTFHSKDSIMDDPRLTPVQKTMKILGITEQDVIDARARIKEREYRRRLTEEDEELFQRRKERNGEFVALDDEFEEQISSLRQRKRVDRKHEDKNEASIVSRRAPSPSNESKNLAVESFPREEKEGEETGNLPDQSEVNKLETIDREITKPLTKKKRGGIDVLETSDSKKMKLNMKDIESNSSLTGDTESAMINNIELNKENIESSYSPVKIEPLIDCNCLMDENLFKEIKKGCSLSNALRTSTPKETSDHKRTKSSFQSSSDDIKDVSDPSCCCENEDINQKADLIINDNVALIVNLAQDNLRDNLKEISIPEDQVPTQNPAEPKSELQIVNQSLEISKNESYLLRSNAQANLKEDIRRVTNQMEHVLKSFKDIQEAGNPIKLNLGAPNHNLLFGVLNLSKNVKDMAKSPIQSFGMFSTIELEDNQMKLKSENETLSKMIPVKHTVHTGINPIESNVHKPDTSNTLKANLPEYSFGDTNIPRFYKNSMQVFDGCYQKDFDINPESQSVFQQLEKTKWNLYTDQSNLEPLVSEMVEENQTGPQTSLFMRDHRTSNRFEPVPSLKKPSHDSLTSRKIQVDEKSLNNISSKRIKISKRSSPFSTKSIHTQTESDYPSPKISNNSITESKNRKRVSKRKKLKEQNRNTPSIVNHRETDTQSTKDRSKSGYQSSTKHQGDNKKQSDLSRSSLESTCECKMQQLQAKYSPSSESRLDKENRRKSGSKKVENFGTIAWSEIAHRSYFLGLVNRKKPPACPKKIKTDVPTQTPSVSKNSLIERKSLESKKSKTKSRKEINEDAKTIRALKAYNEITLLKDKKELETKKRMSKNNSELEDPKNRVPWRNSNRFDSKKKIRQDKKPIVKEYLGKENLSVDVSSEEEWPSNAPRKSTSSKGRLVYDSKLHKVHRVTDNRFDRLLHQAKQHTKYTKNRNPKKLMDEEVVSTSSKKFEGIQKGRELEKIPAKENVRGHGPYLPQMSVIEDRKDNVGYGEESDRSLKTIKSNRDVASTSSSSIIHQIDEEQEVVEGKVGELIDVACKIDEFTDNAFDADTCKLEKLTDNVCDAKELINNAWETDEGLTNASRMGELRDDPFKIESREIESPEIESPEIESPEIGSSEIEPSKIELPEIKPPEIEAPEIEAPEIESPEIESPEIESPEIESPEIGSPEIELPEIKPPEIEAPEIESPEIEPPKIESPEIQPPEIEELTSNPDEISRSTIPEGRATLNYAGFVRTIDESYMGHGIVLGNPYSPPEKHPRRRDIVDESTMRLLHNAFSYHSMDSMLDLVDDDLTVIDLANDRQLNSFSSDFICQPNNEVIDQFVVELPVTYHDDIELEFSDNARVERIRDLLEVDVQKDEFLRVTDSRRASVFRTMNIGVVNWGEHIDRIAEMLQDLIPYSIEEEEDEENQLIEDEEEISEEDNQIPRFITDDIFTDIKFPVVINRSAFTSNFLVLSNEYPERSNPLIREREPIESLALVEQLNKGKKLAVENVKFRTEGVKNVEQTVYSTRVFSVPASRAAPSKFERNTVYTEEEFEQQLREIEEDFNKISLTDSPKLILRDGAMETRDDARKDTEKKIVGKSNSESKEIEQIEEELSLKVIFTFCMIVIFFYIQYFYQKIFSFVRVSKSTSTLKPYEVHTVPTSTTKLLQRIEAKKGEEEEEEEEDVEQNIVDLENFSLKKQFSEMDLSLATNSFSSGIIEIEDDGSKKVEKEREVEEALLYLSRQIVENVEIPSFSSTDSEKTRSSLQTNSFIRSIKSLTSEDIRLKDAQVGEKELETFRFKEVDDSSSNDDQLIDNDRLICLYAEAEVNENGSDYQKEETPEAGKESSPKQQNNEDEAVAEEKIEETLLEMHQRVLRCIDSFDSTYSELSETSRRTISDLNESSFEEFISASNSFGENS